ncbi:DUF3152 domain-containing protein [Streptomyces sp. NPDC001820]|uniref:DUF3152 domain-containing protein n=1 Tax=Streptomyces sp. NPDC001820 TaxID=3364613 RepID=UPI0036911C0E
MSVASKRAAARRGRSRSRSRGRRPTRGPLARILPLGAALFVLSLGGGVALAHWHGTAKPVPGAADDTDLLIASPSVTPEASDPPRADRSIPEQGRTPPSPRPPVKVPASGPGTFTTAQASGRAAGSGPPRRYRVQVEDGIDISAKDAAAEIEQILAHPRGWAAHGRGSFRLVSGDDADFVIRIATPATADRLCRAQGLDTGGELNCETADGVVVNLRRWMLGSPTFTGSAAEYRHLIINHEVGHEIGNREHLGCPGPGRLAPVMMQQIKGLDGCRSNAWPYDQDGTYITGPTL